MKLTLASIILGLAISSLARAQTPYTPLNPWQGELLQQGYGAFYTKLELKGFKKDARTRNFTANVFLHLYELKLKQHYVLSQPVVEESRETSVWKIPAGNYLISKLSFNDNNGQIRSWTSTGRPVIGIRTFFLSNLGLIRLEAQSKTGLRPAFISQPNTYIDQTQHDAFAGVIDAYSLKVQESLGGRSVLVDAGKGFGSKDEMRAAFSQERQIAMYYKVDLATQDYLAAKISNTVGAQDLDLRRCYMDELEKDKKLKGSVIFNFKIAASDGTMRKIFYRGGSIKNPQVIQCLYHALGRMQFPLAKALDGQLTFSFTYR